MGAVPAKLKQSKCIPRGKQCFATPVVKFLDNEVQSVQILLTEGDEYPRYVKRMRAVFPNSPDTVVFSFARKMRNFTFKPNRIYSDWISGQELDVKFYETYTKGSRAETVAASLKKLGEWGGHRLFSEMFPRARWVR